MIRRMFLLLGISAALGACQPVTRSVSGGVAAREHARKNTYHLTVVDASSKAVPYATIWYLQKHPNHPELTPEVMATLLKHYSSDADYVADQSLQQDLLITYTDAEGHADLIADGWSYEDQGSSTSFITIAALKRGYTPAMDSDEAPYISERSMTLRLNADASGPAEPLLLELDRIRSQAKQSAQLGLMSGDRQQFLAGLQQELRGDAAKLEAAGKPDAAGRIYYYLAYVPGVLTHRKADGTLTSYGYINGFDKDDPQRSADRDKAVELNTSVPDVLFDKALKPFATKDIFHDINYGTGKTPERAAFLTMAEGFEQKYGERLWPWFFTTVADKYGRQGEYAKACHELQEAYDLQPGFNDLKGWWSSLELMQYYENGKTEPITVCSLKGLAPKPARLY